MEIKILQVFYDKNGLPYKDKERTVHYPITSGTFLGASNTTQIRFYYDQLDELNESTFVAVSKLPNGKIGSEILESEYDSELQENYAVLNLSQFYTQYKGDVYISLQGYQGGVRVEQDEDGIYQIYGTPTIQATGSIKLSIAYAPTFIGSGETENITLQRVLAELSTKLGIRQETLHVEELPTVGNPNVWYVVNDDPNDTTKANIYIWNATTQTYVWVGDNTLDLDNYYTREQGEQFESGINNRVSSVENELSSVAQGSPKGVYATLSDLESAYPTGTTGIYVVSADGHWYYWNGSAWTSGGQYLSSGNAIDIPTADQNFTAKRDFLSKIGENELELISLTTMTSGKYVDYSAGNLGNNEDYSASDYIEILYNSLFVVKDGNSLFVAFYNKDKEYVSGYDLSPKNFLKVPNNKQIVYMRFSLLTSRLSGNFVKIIKYVNEQDKNNLSSSIGIKEINLISEFIDGKYVSSVSGYYLDNDTFTSTTPIEVIPNATYKLTGVDSGAQGSFFDKDGNYISGFVSENTKEITIPNNISIKYMTWCSTLANKSNMGVYLKNYYDALLFASMGETIPLVQGKTKNIVDINNLLDGYYVNYNSGEIGSAASYSTTDYIEIIPNLNMIAKAPNSSGSQCAFYDKDKVYISGVITGLEKIFIVPSNAKYIRWCFETVDKNNVVLSYDSSNEQPYEITTSIGLLQGLINAYSQGCKKVVVRVGTYDIIQEYEDKYGNDYFENYAANYNGNVNGVYDYGLWLENIEIKFDQGTKVVANYTGNNAYVKEYFSAFAVGRNVIIDSLVLEASELRYGLHPDYNGNSADETYLIVKNGDYSFVKGDYNVQSFGCGLGKSCLWTFENNIFRTPLDANLAVVRIHNNVNDNVQSKIIFRNNYIYGKGHFKLNYYGSSTKITNILICGNSWINPPQKADEQSGSVDNFNLIVYNNETRS